MKAKGQKKILFVFQVSPFGGDLEGASSRQISDLIKF